MSGKCQVNRVPQSPGQPETVGGNPIYDHSGRSNTQMFTANIGKMQITFQFGPFDNAK